MEVKRKAQSAKPPLLPLPLFAFTVDYSLQLKHRNGAKSGNKRLPDPMPDP